MSLTNYPNGVSSFGVPVTGSIPMVLGASGIGNIYFVDATNGSDGNSGLSADQAFKTLAVAYAAASSGDTIALSTNSTHSLTAGIAWTKSRINLVGLDFHGRLVQQGAKVQLATAATSAYVLKVTGTRNSFSNIKFIQAATAATGLHVLEEGGEGTLYQNCSFTFGVADNLDLTTASEVIMGGDSCTFSDCQFGVDTLLTSAARSVMTIDQVTSGQECKSNIFRDCTWLISSSEANALMLSMAAAGDILFTNHIIRPSFLASLDSAGGVALTKGVTTANGTTKGTIYISYPMVHGITDLGVNGTNNDNLYVFSHVPSAADITSAQPTTS